MATSRIRHRYIDPKTGKLVVVNKDEPVGNGPAYAGKRLSAATAMPVGHMNPGNKMKGITDVQRAGLYEATQRFNGPIAPSKEKQ